MKVALMVSCLNDSLFPDTGVAVVRLLRRLGVEVDFPRDQTCCGQPMINSGYWHQALPLAAKVLDEFAGYDHVVTPSASCAGAVRHQYEMVLERVSTEDHRASAADLAPKVRELSEFLVDVLGVEDVGAEFPFRVAYHPTCHSSRMIGLDDRPLRLLRRVRGLELAALPNAESCCGFGGTFAVKNEATSVAMGSDKAEAVVASGADYVVAVDNSCLMQIGGILSRTGSHASYLHLAEVLARTSADS